MRNQRLSSLSRITRVVPILITWAAGMALALADTDSAAALSTHVEQVAATVNGRIYKAQITRVHVPVAETKNIVVHEIAISSGAGPARFADSVTVEAPAKLNGTPYIASVPEPLPAQDRAQALSLAQNQVDWVRRNAPPEIAQRVQSYPTYSDSVSALVLRYDFTPTDSFARAQIQGVTRSALDNSEAAFAQIAREEQVSSIEAARFAQAYEQGQDMTLGLRKAAERSSFTFTQSLNSFSLGMQSLHDRETQNLAFQIAQADPILENILSDGESEASPDIRRATADVSPLNPHASENRRRYGDRFESNGLLKDGLFSQSEPFPATPAGHRLLESANLLSDAVARDLSLTTRTASAQLMGAGYVYLQAAMQAERAGRTADAERWTAEGRRIARALRGEALPDDLEKAVASPAQATAVHERAVRDTLGLSGEGRDLLKQAFATVEPSSVEGKVAVSLGRSLVQNPRGLSDAELSQVGLTLLDVGLGMIPGVSPIKSLLYMAAGRNLLTGQELTSLDYSLCAIDVLSLGGSGAFAKVAGSLPEILGPAFTGSRALLTGGLKTGAAYIKDFGGFIEGSVKGIRDIERVAPGFALKNFASNPGAVLALGRNVSRYGGSQLAKNLVDYSAKNSLSIVETAHLSRFAGGYSKFVTVAEFEKYASQTSILAGREGGRMFVTATNEFEQAAKGMSGDAELARWLGLDAKAAQSSGGYMRLDMEFSLSVNPRLPEGTEAGVNQFFRSGGKTNGGAIELVIDPVPMNKVTVRGKVEL